MNLLEFSYFLSRADNPFQFLNILLDPLNPRPLEPFPLATNLEMTNIWKLVEQDMNEPDIKPGTVIGTIRITTTAKSKCPKKPYQQ